MHRPAVLLCAAALAGLAAERVIAQADDTLETLLHFRKCPLNLYLEAVYKYPAKVEGRARFLTVTVTERTAAFVQCTFSDSAVICEASAFDGGTEANKTPLPLQSVAALQRLGFVVELEDKNLTYRRPFRGSPDFDAIAVLMLTALYDAYGVREETELKTYAPFAGNIITVCRY